MTPADRWIRALHDSSLRLATTVARLGPDELAAPSYADGWSIGQVLSHLGSAAEICTGLLKRGLAGDVRAPVREELRGGAAPRPRPQPPPGPADHGRPDHRRRPAGALPGLLSPSSDSPARLENQPRSCCERQ
ncbi:hypothetical protein GCM10018793_70710 [Streptomyces sulfonofaciens]|uniref:Mycothiol-dependent maleylpyruvate isomerase metal-binding domain-containing protein n=1 Tax=Streptomyces sulfonofaciens TaxID=68272 RepID=A0A919GQM1_9ACTN|nr:maleylpyruvate isomerase N-terminal domain-containing protein [Streptomyces sulfonofaciens]GHH89014.1 hypothetical protein GCM10018793_70710 [Streptomyces sulfonofaciens]